MDGTRLIGPTVDFRSLDLPRFAGPSVADQPAAVPCTGRAGKHWHGFEGESELRPMFDPGMGP
jgi:hypothetical protein